VIFEGLKSLEFGCVCFLDIWVVYFLCISLGTDNLGCGRSFEDLNVRCAGLGLDIPLFLGMFERGVPLVAVAVGSNDETCISPLYHASHLTYLRFKRSIRMLCMLHI